MKDLSLRFSLHPVTNDLLVVSEENSIKQSLRAIVLSNHHERPYKPYFGANIINQLFENWTPFMAKSLERQIIEAITLYEPRVRLLGVEIVDRSEFHAIRINIYYTIVSDETQETHVLTLERVR